MPCSTSSTTIPGPTSCSNSLNSPPLASPRHTLNLRLGTVDPSVELLERCVSDCGEFGGCRWTQNFFNLHITAWSFANHDVVFDPFIAFAFVIEACVRTARFLTHVRSASDGFARDEH